MSRLVAGLYRSSSSLHQSSLQNHACRPYCAWVPFDTPPCPNYLDWTSHAIGVGIPSKLWCHWQGRAQTTRQWPSVGHSHTLVSYVSSQSHPPTGFPSFSLIYSIRSYRRMRYQIVRRMYYSGTCQSLGCTWMETLYHFHQACQTPCTRQAH